MKNILFFDHQAEMGGGEFSLIEAIKVLDKNKFNPIVMLGNRGPFKERLDEIGVNTGIIEVPEYFRTFKRDPLRKNNFIMFVKTALTLPKLISTTEKIIKQKKANLIFLNTIKSAFFGISAANKAKIKSIWIIRDCLTKDFYRPFFLKQIAHLAKKADRIICTSEEVKSNLLKITNNKVKSKVIIIYNGVDLNKFSPSLDGENIKRELSLQNTRVVTLIGRLEPWKGQIDFIEAAKLALEKRKNLKFLIVGGPLFGRQEYEKKCRNLVEELGLKKEILFLGFRKDVFDIMAASDIIVHTSTLPEPFGRDIIEAMACGKPVISTNIGGPKEIITPETGILIEPNRPDFLAEEVIRLIDDPEQRNLLGKNARKRAEEIFDIKTTTQQMESILEEKI